MSDWLGLGGLVLDVALLAWSANRLLRWTRFTVRDFPAYLLGHAIGAVAIFAVVAQALGFAGALFPGVLTLALGLTAVILHGLAARRRNAGGRIRRRDRWRREWSALSAGSRAVLTGLLVGGVVIAALAAPCRTLVPDDLSYRLPRIAVWLQTGNLATIGAEDVRLDCLPFLADLLQCAIAGHWDSGFPAVMLVSCAGAALAVLATLASGRLLRIAPCTSALAATLIVLCPAAFAQLFTAQIDVITTGVFAAGGYFVLRAWRTRRPSWLAGVAIGLAFAMKNTPIYLGPALAVLGLAAFLARHVTLRFAFRQALFTAVSIVLFAGPKLAQNCRNFGNPLGPRDLIARHTPGHGVGGSARIFERNVAVWAVHNLDPNANPGFLRPTLSAMTPSLLERWVADSVDSGMTLVPNRRAALQTVFAAPGPEADTPSFGIALTVAGALAVLAGLGQFRRRRAAPWVAAAILVTGWFVTMAALAWHPYGYRYSILVLPALALCLAAAANSAGRLGHIGLALLVAWQLAWAGGALRNGYQYGPQVGREAGASLLDYLDLQGKVVASLPAHVQRLGLVATETATTTGFFRTGRDCEVQFCRAEDVRRAGSPAEFAARRRFDALVFTAGSGFESAAFPGWIRRDIRVNNAPTLSFFVVVPLESAAPSPPPP